MPAQNPVGFEATGLQSTNFALPMAREMHTIRFARARLPNGQLAGSMLLGLRFIQFDANLLGVHRKRFFC